MRVPLLVVAAFLPLLLGRQVHGQIIHCDVLRVSDGSYAGRCTRNSATVALLVLRPPRGLTAGLWRGTTGARIFGERGDSTKDRIDWNTFQPAFVDVRVRDGLFSWCWCAVTNANVDSDGLHFNADQKRAGPISLADIIKLGEGYLQEYPNGKYGGYITKTIEFARISLNEEKIAQAQAFRSLIQSSLAKDATRLEFLLKEALNERTDVNATTRDGRTALMFAAAERRAEAVKALLEKGASADVIENTQRLTALIYAIWAGDRNLVRNLLQYYPDATIKDEDGRTALDHAMLSADFEMMLLIIGRPMPGVSS